MSDRRTAALIYNPCSGAHRKRDRGSDAADMIRKLAGAGVDAQPWPTPGPGTAAELARVASERGVDLVIASGGDGTINEIVQGMACSRTPMAIWPGGTANVLARELAIPTDPDGVVATIAADRQERIALGKAGERYFALMAGIGLDASIVRGVSPELKASYGEGAFWVSGLKHAVAWRPEPFTIDVDGRTIEGSAVIVGNAARYGGSLSITPHASIAEPALDVCVFPTRKLAVGYVADVLACAFGDPTRFGDVTYLKTTALTASGAPGNQPWVQVDGELLGQLPMRFESVPDALTVIVGPGWTGSESS